MYISKNIVKADIEVCNVQTTIANSKTQEFSFVRLAARAVTYCGRFGKRNDRRRIQICEVFEAY